MASELGGGIEVWSLDQQLQGEEWGSGVGVRVYREWPSLPTAPEHTLL